ncbi:hypothetical protein FOL46_006195 [Perkinsus olseni]|uniref:Uncharacterized protein n=1 Tax=Perkinsus olseni TaxID=32597 RepID=A0A7J6LLX1_PEROL|nr:hypothetical protein FOL46_006195 [Perkinsus olseni]
MYRKREMEKAGMAPINAEATMKKMYDQVIGRQLERQKLIHAAEKKGPSLVEPDDDALETERKMRKKREAAGLSLTTVIDENRLEVSGAVLDVFLLLRGSIIKNIIITITKGAVTTTTATMVMMATVVTVDNRMMTMKGKENAGRIVRGSQDETGEDWEFDWVGLCAPLTSGGMGRCSHAVQALMMKIDLRPARAVDIMLAIDRRRVATKGDRPSRKVLTVDEAGR